MRSRAGIRRRKRTGKRWSHASHGALTSKRWSHASHGALTSKRWSHASHGALLPLRCLPGGGSTLASIAVCGFASLLASLFQPDALIHAVAFVAVPRARGAQARDGGLEVAAEGLFGARL